MKKLVKKIRTVFVILAICVFLITPAPFYINLEHNQYSLAILCGASFFVSVVVLLKTSTETYKKALQDFMLACNLLDPIPGDTDVPME